MRDCRDGRGVASRRAAQVVASFGAACIACTAVVLACGGRVERPDADWGSSTTANNSGDNSDQPGPPAPGFGAPSSSGGHYGGPPNPRPPRYTDAGFDGERDGGNAECEARPTKQCEHCRDCDQATDTQATLNFLLKKCGRLCGDIIVDFDDSGCALRVYAQADQQSLQSNFECVLSELRSVRWSCASSNTSVWASFGGYCSK